MAPSRISWNLWGGGSPLAGTGPSSEHGEPLAELSRLRGCNIIEMSKRSGQTQAKCDDDDDDDDDDGMVLFKACPLPMIIVGIGPVNISFGLQT
jgi:hypothetical protein